MPRLQNRYSSAALFVSLAWAGVGDAQLDEPFPALWSLMSLDPNEGGDGSLGFKINGYLAAGSLPWLGRDLESAGDLNNDGLDDIVLGSYIATPNGDDANRREAGRVVVIYGRSEPFPAEFDPNTIDGENGFIINGAERYGYVGYSVAGGGDVNNDGIDDLLIGAGSNKPCYVIFGRDSGAGHAFPTELELAELGPDDGFLINLNTEYINLAGDINNDGIDDIVLGKYPAQTPRGAYVLFGKDTAAGDVFPSVVELEYLDGQTGFSFAGANGPGPASAAGDLNNDGIDDVIFGNPNARGTGRARSGGAYVVFGRDTSAGASFPPIVNASDLDGVSGFKAIGIDADTGLGESVDCAGDLNNDGLDDIVMGSSGNGFCVLFGRDAAGQGAFPPVLDLSDLDGHNGFWDFGYSDYPVNEAGLGYGVSGAGDLNSDGIDDLLVGAFRGSIYSPDFDTGGGLTQIVYGRSAPDGFHFPPVLTYNPYSAVSVVSINGAPNDRGTGFSVAGTGDFNGDGVADFMIGTFEERNVYVVYGRTASVPCPSDANGDGFLTPADFQAWLAAFAGQTPACDQNHDGLCTTADFNAWIANFNEGCGF